MFGRDLISRALPSGLRTWLRPRVIPVLYRLEQRRMRRLYKGLVRPGDLVFDVGAAEGYHSEVFAQLGARVLCVEPQPHWARALKRRFEDDERVTVLAGGVAQTAGEGTLFMCRADPEISTFVPETWGAGRFAGRSWNDQVSVTMVTLDQLISEHGGPNFVKIDVEGMEGQVLAGLSSGLPALSFEFCCEFMEAARQCVERIQTLGPARFNYSLGRKFELECPTWVNERELFQILESIRDPRLQGDIYARSVQVGDEEINAKAQGRRAAKAER